MNMQAMIKQAQNLQKKMLSEQEEINNMDFVGEAELVKISMKGTKRVTKVEIKEIDDFSKEDLEMLEDMVLVAVNDALSQIDKVTEEIFKKN